MWIKLDDGFATHPKILRAGVEATVLQIRALCYASQNKTDGLIPKEAVPMLLTGLTVNIDTMVQHHLWEVSANSYQIHDYLAWNMSRDEYYAMKLKLSKAGKKGMKSRWKKDNAGYKVGNKVSDNLSHNPAITGQSTSTDTLSSPSSSESDLNLQSKTETKEFEQFWVAYPKKVGKLDAWKAWKKAAKPAVAIVLAAITQAMHSEQWTKEQGQFIPNPSTWLNQGRWADEPCEMKGRSNGKAIPPFPGPDDPIGRGLWRQTWGDPTNPRART